MYMQQSFQEKIKQLEREKAEGGKAAPAAGVATAAEKEVRALKTQHQILQAERDTLKEQNKRQKEQLDAALGDCREVNELRQRVREMETTIEELCAGYVQGDEKDALVKSLRGAPSTAVLSFSFENAPSYGGSSSRECDSLYFFLFLSAIPADSTPRSRGGASGPAGRQVYGRPARAAAPPRPRPEHRSPPGAGPLPPPWHPIPFLLRRR